jgi:hypothetical protein
VRYRVPCFAWLLALVLPGALPAQEAGAEGTFAGRIDATSHARLAPGGPDAIGGVGDWALTNGVLCAVLSDPSHESDLAVTGGVLVDLGRCGWEEDQFLILEQLLDLSLERTVPVRSVQAHADTQEAQLVTRGERDGLELETRYTLDLERPTRLRIATRLLRRGEGEPVFALGLAHGNIQQLTPFSRSLEDPRGSPGFDQVAFLGRGVDAATRAARPLDLVVSVGEGLALRGVAYGARLVRAELERGSGEREPLPHFVLADDLVTMWAFFAQPFWIGGGEKLGWLQLVQSRFMDLEAGDALVIEQELWLGDRSDVASVTDQLLRDAPLVAGHVDDPESRIHVHLPDGSAVTEVRPSDEGLFTLRLPARSYELRILAPGGREARHSFAVGEEGADLGFIQVGRPARVRLPRGQPMRLTFVGESGTPDPRFLDDLLGFRLDGSEDVTRTGGVRDLALAGVPGDPEAVSVRPGRYLVYASRGPEYSVTSTTLELDAGEVTSLEIDAPTREVETPGWISADFHVHGARSPDTGLPMRERVRSFAAEGAEVLVSTDHDVVADYAPVIRSMGLASRLASIVGLEVTSEVETAVAPYTIGHANAFPVPLDARAYRSGAVDNEGRRWRQVIADLRALPGERVIQLNHARAVGDGPRPRAFFSHLGNGVAFDPRAPLSAAPHQALRERDPETGFRDLDFDAMEIMNGARLGSYELLRADWFSLLRQGVVLAGTANSDSHTLSQVAAAPRSYVRVADDRVSTFEVDPFVTAIRRGRLFGTTGPMVTADLDGAGVGEIHRGREGRLHVEVRAASWVPVAELRVFLGGELLRTEPISRGSQLDVLLDFEADTFLTVEVSGEPGPVYEAVLPGMTPRAFTNPIYVDADADGRWTPPGL